MKGVVIDANNFTPAQEAKILAIGLLRKSEEIYRLSKQSPESVVDIYDEVEVAMQQLGIVSQKISAFQRQSKRARVWS